MSTPSVKKGEIKPTWHIVDVEGQTLGRVCSQIAAVLKGKHRPQYTPHAHLGDHVVVINAEKVKLTGRKLDQMTFYYHTGYPGGIKSSTAKQTLEKKPEDLIYNAVRRMLPRSPLGREMMSHLRVYAGAEHPHVAQQPQPLEFPY